MLDVADNCKSNNPTAPVIGLSFFAVASGFLMSLIPLSLGNFGLSPDLAPWLASIFYLGLLLGALRVERLIAQMGHRRGFVLFLSLLIASIVAMLLLPGAGVWLAARLLAGFAVAGVFVVVESWLLMADSAKARARRLGIYMAALYGGSALGQLAIGELGTQGVLPYLFVIVLLLLAIMAPVLIRSGEPAHQAQQRLSLKESTNLSRPALIGCLVSGLLLGPIYGLMPVYIDNQVEEPAQTGLLMAAIILGGMAVQPLISYLSPRMDKRLLMAMCTLVGLVGVVGAIESSALAFKGLSYFILGAASFALYPIAISLACDRLPSIKIVSATEVMLLCYSLGSVAGPLLALTLSNKGHGMMIYLAICLLSTCLYMLLKSLQKLDGQTDRLQS
ncbi:MFS transporter [Shewanella sp. KCT]|uniref:MFS transporter n=1 Tax=Shewanella sp. KCT TaxID=2569535 RepID=UPI001181E679|nr:MFS transporter [Shewanella sp. KCT]TVP13353.1 MFS transporter [Shewanella sp. KCT]